MLHSTFGIGDGGEANEVRVESLPVGTHFRLHLYSSHRDGLVLRHGRGSSFVLVEAPIKKHEWVTATGKQVAFASGATRNEYWALTTMVEPLKGAPKETAASVEEFLRSMEYHPTKEEVENMGTVALPGIKGNKKAKTAKVKREKKVVELHDCLCGCGSQVGGRFKMGHDGKFYAFLRKLTATPPTIKFSEMPKIIQQEVKNTEGAKAYLKSHGH